MIIVDTEQYKTLAEKGHILQRLKNKFNNVTFSFMDELNMIIFQYDDGQVDC